MNFSAFIASLGIMLKGMLGIFAVMAVIWLMIVCVRKIFR